MIRDAVAEHGLPGIREAPERGRHMGADRLAFRPRGALTGAAVEFGKHVLVRHGGRLHVADARAHGSSGSFDLARTMPQQANGRNLRMAAARENPFSALAALALEVPEGYCPPQPNNHRRSGAWGISKDERRRRAFPEPA